MPDTPTPVPDDMPEASFEAAIAAAAATMPELSGAVTSAVPELSGTPASPAVTDASAQPATPAPDLRVGDLEARLRAAEEALAAAKASPPPVTTDWSTFESDPVGTIRRANPNLTPAQAAKVAEKLYFHALGDQAPAEYRLREELNAAVDPRIAKLEAELAAERTARESRDRAAQIAAYQGELRSSGAQLAADKFPILGNLAKRDPDAYTEVLYNVAVQDARDLHSAGKPYTKLTPAEVAERAEKLLTAQRDRLYGPPEPQSTPALFSHNTAAQPSRTPPGALDDKTLRAAALKAAGLDIPAWD